VQPRTKGPKTEQTGGKKLESNCRFFSREKVQAMQFDQKEGEGKGAVNAKKESEILGKWATRGKVTTAGQDGRNQSRIAKTKEGEKAHGRGTGNEERDPLGE